MWWNNRGGISGTRHKVLPHTAMFCCIGRVLPGDANVNPMRRSWQKNGSVGGGPPGSKEVGGKTLSGGIGLEMGCLRAADVLLYHP